LAAWAAYLASGDVGDTADRVTAAGGQLTTGAIRVTDQGRMAIALDPTGAAFGLWQAGTNPGASLVGEPGAVSWTELQTGDLDAAQAFYTAIFGYTWQETPAGCGMRPSRPAAGWPARWPFPNSGTPANGPTRAG